MTLRSVFHAITGFPSNHPCGLTLITLMALLFVFHGPVFGAIGGSAKAIGGSITSLADSPSDYVEDTLTEASDNNNGKIDQTTEAIAVLNSEYEGQSSCVVSTRTANEFACAVTDVETLDSEHYRVSEDGTITKVDVKAEREAKENSPTASTTITTDQAVKTIQERAPEAKVACSLQEDSYSCAATDLDSFETLVFEVDKTTGAVATATR